jgi:hypothetical protein
MGAQVIASTDSARYSMLSLEYERLRACTGKVRHLSREEAEEVAERQSRKLKLGETVRLKAYRCEFCFNFHTGRNYEPGFQTVPALRGHQKQLRR